MDPSLMLRLFSPFTTAGRFALMLVINLIASGGLSAQEQPREHERRGPTLIVPSDGAVVDHQFVVRIGFAGGGKSGGWPGGPSEGTGIMEGPPPPPPNGGPTPRPNVNDRGPSQGTGLGGAPDGGNHGQRRSHFVLVVDAPALENGSAYQADAQHIAFPAGSPQMTLTLPPGQHHLLLQTLDRDGEIMQRRPSEGVQVTVR